LTIDELVELAQGHASLPDAATRRALRIQAGLSMRQVGEAVGVSINAVQAWERGAEPRGSRRTEYAALLERLASEVGS